MEPSGARIGARLMETSKLVPSRLVSRSLVVAQARPRRHLGKYPVEVVARVLVEYLAIALADHLGGACSCRDARRPGSSLVTCPSHVEAHDGVFTALHDGGEQCPDLLRALLLGYVVSDAQGPYDVPVRGQIGAIVSDSWTSEPSLWVPAPSQGGRSARPGPIAP